MDTPDIDTENSNLQRLNGILQARVDDLTDKLKTALQVQKDHLEELVRSQQIWRKDYSKIEEKYFLLEKENDRITRQLNESNKQIIELKEVASEAARKFGTSNTELIDLRNQNSVLHIQLAEAHNNVSERDEMFAVLKRQFEIVGKEFVDLKTFSDSERSEHQQLIRTLSLEKQQLGEAIVQLDSKCRSQLGTQQELNDLMHSLGAKLQISEDALANEKKRVVEIENAASISIAACEAKCSELMSKQTLLVAQVSEIPALKSANEKQAVVYAEVVAEKAHLTAELNQLRFTIAAQTAKLDECAYAGKAQTESISALELNITGLQEELHTLRSKCDEQQFTIENLNSQLTHSERRLQENFEEGKIQLQESNEKIYSLRSSNTQLEQDFAIARQNLTSLQNELNSAKIIISGLNCDLEEYKSKYQSTYARLQALEDQHELDVAKIESLSEELVEAKENLTKYVSKYESDVVEALQHQKSNLSAEYANELATLKLSIQANQEKVIDELKAQHAADVTQAIEMSLQTLRKQYEQKHLEMKQELKACKKAMEDLSAKLHLSDVEQSKLRAKLKTELQAAETLTSTHSAAMNAATVRIQELEAAHLRDIKKMDERLKEMVTEMQLLEEDNNRLYRERDLMQEKFSTERDEREALSQQLQSSEHRLTEQLDKKAKQDEDLETSRNEIIAWSRKYAALIHSHDAEMQRMLKRNQVLTETVNRLTDTQTKPHDRRTDVSGVDNAQRIVYEKPSQILPSEGVSDIVSSVEREQARWSQSPPSAQRRKLQMQRGKSAPAVLPLRISTESLTNSIEKAKTPHLDFDSIDYDSYVIQEIQTHRDEETLSSIRQALIDDIRFTIGGVAGSDVGESGPPDTSVLRARTAPPMRTPLGNAKEQPLWMANVDDSSYEKRPKEHKEHWEQTKDGIVEDDTSKKDAAKGAIDRIQLAINQRRGQQARVKGTVIRSKALDKERPNQIQSLSDEANTPIRAQVGDTIKTPISSGGSTTNFTRKLRSSVEDGEHHWIPFSPQRSNQVQHSPIRQSPTVARFEDIKS